MTAPAPVSPRQSPAHVDPLCLLDVFDSIPDPRCSSGRRHSLGALLGLLMVSFMTGKQTVKDAVLFGRLHPSLRELLGFTHPKCPSQSTYTRLFHVLPVESLRGAVSGWLAYLAEQRCHRSRPMTAAVDGKAVRGAPGIHALNIFAHDYWMLLDQYEVAKSKENELTVFRERLEEFLARYPFVRILTMDAAFCEAKTMEALTSNNRLGIFQVKENQKTACFELERFFRRMLFEGSPDYREAEKKWGLHRDARAVGMPRAAAHS